MRHLIIFFFIINLFSCQTQTSSTEGGGSSGGEQIQSGNSSEPACVCTSSNVRSLANQVVSNFTQIQNDFPSDIARIMRIEEVEPRDNCTWVVTFKISWPFGNTDGAHPDEFIKKRYACDGKEVYEQ
jgi:hypothetical protein